MSSGKPQPPFDEPMTAKSIDGEVAITGPGHIHGSMTPKAAKDSAARLKEVADDAEGRGPEEGEAPDPPD
ncbi:hypothetical protein ACFODL_08585 [Phenylobacterium terrae]|uniref:Uncharacterized protein n=1 Tax=Phenylobacterium terrae TaxID=2665495 RepID=A0ABW4N8Q8_9CAUL